MSACAPRDGSKVKTSFPGLFGQYTGLAGSEARVQSTLGTWYNSCGLCVIISVRTVVDGRGLSGNTVNVPRNCWDVWGKFLCSYAHETKSWDRKHRKVIVICFNLCSIGDRKYNDGFNDGRLVDWSDWHQFARALRINWYRQSSYYK